MIYIPCHCVAFEVPTATTALHVTSLARYSALVPPAPPEAPPTPREDAYPVSAGACDGAVASSGATTAE